jgi:hypothetical protein
MATRWLAGFLSHRSLSARLGRVIPSFGVILQFYPINIKGELLAPGRIVVCPRGKAESEAFASFFCILKMGDRDELARTREPGQSKWVMPPHSG